MSRPSIGLTVAGCTAGASTIVALFALIGPPASDDHAFTVILTGLAWLGAAIALGCAVRHVGTTLDEQRVLGARVAPRAGTVEAARDSLRRLVLGGVWLTLPIAGLALVAATGPGAWDTPSRPWPHAAAAALSAGGLLHATVWLGVLAWWGRASPVWMVLAGAAGSALLALGWSGVLAALAAAPWLAAPVLAGAAMATRDAHRTLWSRTATPGPARQPSPRQRAGEIAAALKGGFARVDPVALPFAAILPGQMVPSLAHDPPRDGLLFVSWASTFDLDSVGRLALLAAGMCLCLRTGALHWRLLLAPGGRSRGALGPDVVLRSWLAAVAWLALMVLVVLPIAVMIDRTGGPGALAVVGEIARRFVPTLLCELLLATALAACVRPWVRSSPAACAIFVGAALAVFAGAAALKLVGGVDPLPGWPREEAHHLGVLALAAVATLVARRVWRRADLRRIVAPAVRTGEARRLAAARPGRSAGTRSRPGA